MRQTPLFQAITLGLTLITSTADAHDGAPISISSGVDHAWQISQNQQLSDQRLIAIQASQSANQSWFPSSPELSGRYLSDRLSEDDGRAEVEVEVEFPLWLPGQKTAIAATLNGRHTLQQASVEAAKLELAGVVRGLYWDLILKRNSLQSAQSRSLAAQRIAEDVQRRIDIGILAETDLLLARAELLSTQAEQLSAQQELYVAERSYLARIGYQQIGHWAMERQGQSRTVDQHPLLQQAVAQLQAARLEVKRMQVEDREHSRLSVGWSNERDDRESPSHSLVQIGFRVPLGKNRKKSSELAEAAADLLETEVQLSALKRELEANTVIALTALNSARLHQRSAQLREQTNNQRKKLDVAAFNAGELGLQAMLASRNQVDQARQNLQQRQIEVARAVSTLNQALGYLPEQVIAQGPQQ